MNLKPNIILAFEDVQRIFDVAVNSMDFGSGFLETDDVDVLRRVAVLIGVDPMVATPSNFKVHYKHPFKPRPGELLDLWAAKVQEYSGAVDLKRLACVRHHFEFLRDTCEHCSEGLNHEVHREV